MDQSGESPITTSIDHITQIHPYAGILVMGDFNRMEDKILKTYPLKQIVKGNTRNNAVLDCIYTNISHYYQAPEVIPPVGNLDHGVILCNPATNCKTKPTPESVTFCSGGTNGKAMVAHSIKTTNGRPLYNLQTCEEQVTYFYNSVTKVLDEHMPLRTIKKHREDKPWIIEGMKCAISYRQAAHKSGNKIRFNYWRNRVNRMKKKLRSKYHHNRSLSTGTKGWYDRTKELLGQNNNKESGIKLLANDNYEGDMGILAEKVNVFFQSVCSDLQPLDRAIVPAPPEQCDDFTIPVDKVESILMKTKTNKSPGPDNLPNWILHDLAPYIAPPICSIFNCSVREGHVPDVWKQANVVPVPKVHPPKDITTDLRPISLTATLCKHLERIVGTWMMNSIKDKLDQDQFGGMPGLSATHVLDYSKAYDHIDHNMVIQKLIDLGVPETITRLVETFLDNRQQRVKIGDTISPWLHLNGSIVQGSWLGPKLFVFMLINMPLDLLTHKYMDDTTITESIADVEASKMQQVADQVAQISEENKMKLNAKKN